MASYLDALARTYLSGIKTRIANDREIPSAAPNTGGTEIHRTIDYGIAVFLLDQLRKANVDRIAPAARIGGLCKLLAQRAGYSLTWSARLGIAGQLVHLGIQRSAFHDNTDSSDDQLILGLSAIIKRELLATFPGRGKVHFATRCYQVCRNFERALQASQRKDSSGHFEALWSMEKNSHSLYDVGLFAIFKRLILEDIEFEPANHAQQSRAQTASHTAKVIPIRDFQSPRTFRTDPSRAESQRSEDREHSPVR